MFTKLKISQRILICLVLAMAFLLVLGSNRLDQRHFSNIQTSVNSVYKDRVVVQNFIYQLTNIIHDKELHLLLKENDKPNLSENKKVTQLLSDFGTTKLTPKESHLLDQLNLQFSSLQELEHKFSETNNGLSENHNIATIKKLNEISLSLNGLANIQLEESKLLTQLSNKSLGMNNLLSKLEMAFLVIIGIAMLALIFNPMKLMHAYPGKPSQN
ncbi:MCP four helix bundle domain-containing protein [Cellulophaga sp. L1A9]|uniref:MCP four helix bundle domain-containing protein n=1 Tax=Cellulophaga sp. L1A9 TaxID=2686362 RepID=UPI00131B504F|nr:MCP four helix bundle domain-containing protein [Cellulophaga sp. L1A9]